MPAASQQAHSHPAAPRRAKRAAAAAARSESPKAEGASVAGSASSVLPLPPRTPCPTILPSHSHRAEPRRPRCLRFGQVATEPTTVLFLKHPFWTVLDQVCLTSSVLLRIGIQSSRFENGGSSAAPWKDMQTISIRIPPSFRERADLGRGTAETRARISRKR